MHAKLEFSVEWGVSDVRVCDKRARSRMRMSFGRIARALGSRVGRDHLSWPRPDLSRSLLLGRLDSDFQRHLS